MLRSMATLIFVSVIGATLIGAPQGARAQAAPERPACALHGQITDEDGGPLPKAFVFLHGDRGAKVNQQVAVDRHGEFKINLHAGLYNLFVSSSGFAPVAQVLDLRSCKPVNVNLMLTIDAEHPEGTTP